MTFQSSIDCITENELRKIYRSHVFLCFFFSFVSSQAGGIKMWETRRSGQHAWLPTWRVTSFSSGPMWATWKPLRSTRAPVSSQWMFQVSPWKQRRKMHTDLYSMAPVYNKIISPTLKTIFLGMFACYQFYPVQGYSFLRPGHAKQATRKPVRITWDSSVYHLTSKAA